MKRQAVAFILIFVLAAAVFTGSTAYVWGHRNDLTFTGEVLSGDRGDAGGAAIKQRSSLLGSLVWNTEYDAGSGESSTESRWYLDYPASYSYDAEPYFYFYAPSLNFGSSWTGGNTDSRPDGLEDEGEYLAEIFDYAMSRIDGYGSWSGRVRLNDFTDYLPLTMDSDMVVDKNSGERAHDMESIFRIPLNREVWLDVSCSLDEYGGSFDIREDTLYYDVNSNSVYAADGNLYVLLDIREYVDDVAARSDCSLLPGGDFGIYRIPCEPSEAPYEISNWPMQLTADFDAVENIYPLGSGWDSAYLQKSSDGENLLLFTAESGSLRLTVIDPETGGVLQQEELLGARQAASFGQDIIYDHLAYSNFYQLDGGFVLDFYPLLIEVRYENGLYRAAQVIDRSTWPVPEGLTSAGAEVHTGSGGLQFVANGARLYILERGYYPPLTEGEDYLGYDVPFLRLLIYEGGQSVYAEWITNPLLGMRDSLELIA